VTPPDRGAFLCGDLCYLRPLERADIEGNWLHWFNDPEVTRYMLRGTMPTTVESQTAFYESVVTGSDSDLVLAIVSRDDDVHLGNIGLHRIDWQHGSAEYGIVVGERDHWGRGVATEATRLICRHGFERLNLHRIWLGVIAEHEAAIRVYRRAGFVEEGRHREEVLRDGRRCDVLIMGLLRGELRER
jgi:RimJ/RimL family protein N-acetyltransferase